MLIHCVYADMFVVLYVWVHTRSIAVSLCTLPAFFTAHLCIDKALNYDKPLYMQVLDQVLHIVSILIIIGVFA